MVAKLNRRDFLLTALLAPFLASWRVFFPPIQQTAASLKVGNFPDADLMAVTDYQALYANVLDRMYYGYYDASPKMEMALPWPTYEAAFSDLRAGGKRRKLSVGRLDHRSGGALKFSHIEGADHAGDFAASKHRSAE